MVTVVDAVNFLPEPERGDGLDEAVHHIEHLRLGARDLPQRTMDTGRS